MNSLSRTFPIPVLLLAAGLALGTVACGSDATISAGRTETPTTTIVVEEAEAPENPEPDDGDDGIVSSTPDEDAESGNDQDSGEPNLDDMNPNVDVDEVDGALKGLSLAEAETWAKKNGMSVRVVEEDGEMFAVTMDFSPSRINVAIADGAITSVVNLG